MSDNLQGVLQSILDRGDSQVKACGGDDLDQQDRRSGQSSSRSRASETDGGLCSGVAATLDHNGVERQIVLGSEEKKGQEIMTAHSAFCASGDVNDS